MLIGPHTPPATLVSDVERIETLSQIGLIFLMFSIGLGSSLRKLRRLGPGMVLATFAGAVVMYHLTRFFGFSIGWDSNQGLFLAGMLMVSSSAIISKVLHESGANHERAGQLAMGVSVLEDVVAVVMLTLLGSMANVETAPAGGCRGHAGAAGRVCCDGGRRRTAGGAVAVAQDEHRGGRGAANHGGGGAAASGWRWWRRLRATRWRWAPFFWA
jgi:CPA2 family monovalent cation:H+ antiporter-2